MRFFQRLFASKGSSDQPTKSAGASAHSDSQQDGPPPVYIATQQYFDERYEAEYIEAAMLDGCLKMVDSYFVDNQLERKVAHPINHPANLDQTDQEGFGFGLYCKAFQLGEKEAVLFLAFAFSDYMMKHYDFKLYRDRSPENPLRTMTLKYDKDGVVLSLYPFEYSRKVLTGNETFTGLVEKIEASIGHMPAVNDFIGNLTADEG